MNLAGHAVVRKCTDPGWLARFPVSDRSGIERYKKWKQGNNRFCTDFQNCTRLVPLSGLTTLAHIVSDAAGLTESIGLDLSDLIESEDA